MGGEIWWQGIERQGLRRLSKDTFVVSREGLFSFGVNALREVATKTGSIVGNTCFEISCQLADLSRSRI
jgi:hypothetical protein